VLKLFGVNEEQSVMRKTILCTIGIAVMLWHVPCPATASNIYRVTSKAGGRTITYEVSFGGGKLFDRFTAFDPKSRKFVYLDWKRSGKPPQPAARIWDHRTGESISLYRFPGVAQPLPIIPSLESMKVCPFTGDRHFQASLYQVAD